MTAKAACWGGGRPDPEDILKFVDRKVGIAMGVEEKAERCGGDS